MNTLTPFHSVLAPTADTQAPTVHLIGTSREPRVDSRDIARHLGIQHDNAIQNLNTYRDSFADLGVFRFQTEKPTAATGGRPQRFAMLNEDQAYLLLTMSRNSPRVVALKLRLVKAFRDSRHAVTVYRATTLPVTKELQDAIAAIPGGPGPWLFSNISKLVNKVAGIAAGTRDTLTATQQAFLSLAQQVALGAIRGATDAKDAYARVTAALAPFVGVPVAALGEPA